MGCRAGIHPRRGVVSIPFLRCGGVGAAAARWPGRPVGRPYGQTMKSNFHRRGQDPALRAPANFPLRGFGHTRIRSGESEKPMEKQSLQAFFPVFSIRLLLWGSRGPAGPLSRAPRLGSSGGFFGLFACGAMPRNRAHGTKRDAKTNAKRWFPCSRPRNRGHQAGNPLTFRKSGTFREARTSRFAPLMLQNNFFW